MSDPFAKYAETADPFAKYAEASTPTDGFRTLPGALFPTKQVIAPGTDKPSEQRKDGGIYFGPGQGNKGKPGWFDAKGMRLGDAPGQETSLPDSIINGAENGARKPLIATGVLGDLGSMAGGVVKGGMAMAQIGAHALGSSAMDRPVEQYNQFQTQTFGDRPVMEALGQALPFIGSGGSTAAPQVLTAAQKVRAALAAIGKASATGAVAAPALTGETGVTSEGDYWGRKAKEAALGGVVGGALGTVGEIVGGVANKLTRKLTPEAQAIQDLGDRFGVRTLAPDLVEPGRMAKLGVLAESVPGSGMVPQRVAQQAEAKLAAEKLLAQHGIEGEIPTTIQQGLQSHLAGVKGKVRAAYDEVGRLAEGLGDVPLDQTLATIQKMKAQEAAAVVPDQGLLGLLEKMEGRLTDPAVDTTYTGVRGLRSDLGSMISDYYKGTNATTGSKGVQVLQGVKRAVEEDLGSFTSKAGGDVAKAAKNADGLYVNELVPLKNQVIVKATKNSEPDQIYKTIIAAGPDRAKKFYGALPPEGQAAVRAQMVKDAYTAATDGAQPFSPAKFAQSLEKIKDSAGVFFKGQDKFELDGIVNLMRHVQRSGQVGENPTNGQRAVQALILGQGAMSGAAAATGSPAALVAPVVSMAASRGLTKLFSSRVGKSLLLGAADAAPGSRAMERIIERDLPKVLAPANTPKNITPLRPAAGGDTNPTVAQENP